MTLQLICAGIEWLHLQIRRQQKEVFTLQRSSIGTASAQPLLARMQASVDALCIYFPMALFVAFRPRPGGATFAAWAQPDQTGHTRRFEHDAIDDLPLGDSRESA
jgi:hypothetical protein